MNTDNGGPAFPSVYSDDGNLHGMTLLDWYAGQALIGLCLNDTDDEPGLPIGYAKRALDIAQAVIVERKKRGIE